MSRRAIDRVLAEKGLSEELSGAPDSLVDLCTGEISWDSLGPSSNDNLAGLYYPTASLLKEMPDEACKIVADAAKRCPASATLILTPCGGAAADLPKDAKVLLTGTGNFTRTGKITNGFGTHDIKPVMTDEVAWTWKNKWGGRVFATSLGHPGSFAEEKFIRFYVNGIHWAAGLPVPKADIKFETVAAGMKMGTTGSPDAWTTC